MNSTELAPRGSDKTPVAFGTAPGTLDEAWRWAQQAAQSGLVPKSYFGKPHDILTAIQMGIEIGLAPMTALQSIAVINGRPGVWGDGLLALIMAAPVYRHHAEYYEVATGSGDYVKRDALHPEDLKADTTRAVCVFVRKDTVQPTTGTFSIAQAKRAGLFVKDGPWQTYPDRMLKMRARSWAARDAFPDVLKGLRAAEELADITAEPIDVSPGPVVQRRSEQPQTTAAPEPEAAPVEPVTLIAGVQAIRKKAGVMIVVLTNGHELDLPVAYSDEALDELKKFIGTDHPLRWTCRPDGDRLRVADFQIAE